VVSHQRECERRNLCPVRANDVLVAGFEQQVRDVDVCRLRDLVHEVPVSGVTPGDAGAARQRPLSREEGDDVVTERE
jgi:hypothetical protein